LKLEKVQKACKNKVCTKTKEKITGTKQFYAGKTGDYMAVTLFCRAKN